MSGTDNQNARTNRVFKSLHKLSPTSGRAHTVLLRVRWRCERLQISSTAFWAASPSLSAALHLYWVTTATRVSSILASPSDTSCAMTPPSNRFPRVEGALMFRSTKSSSRGKRARSTTTFNLYGFLERDQLSYQERRRGHVLSIPA